MPNPEWVFYGYTLYDLLLSLGRFLIAVSGSLLAVYNLAWIARRKWRCDKRRWQWARAILELMIGAALGSVYWVQIADVVASGQAQALAPNETLFVVWAFAIVLSGLLVSALAGDRH